ncbi:MAG TPA: cobaltochelatase subunit CobN, partial [Hyphomicrobiales bacterium]|nr:cobaltochelatase subunit CobN [Hyphomicrobiales bacterium]
YHPNAARLFSSLDAFLDWRQADPAQPFVGVGFMRGDLEQNRMDYIDAVIAALEQRGLNVVGYFHPTNGASAHLFYRNADMPPALAAGELAPGTRLPPPALDLAVTFRGVMTSPGLRHLEHEAMQLPMLSAMIDNSRNVQAWLDSSDGYPNTSMAARWTNAEIAGFIDPIVVGALGDDGLPTLIPEQLQALLERVENYLALRLKPNADKQLAIFVWNSPEGEDNFSATYLNVPRSLLAIFTALRGAGYQVDDIDEATLVEKLKLLTRPYYRSDDDAALRRLLAEGLAERYPVQDYLDWFASLPEELRRDVDANWPDAEDNYMTLEEDGQHYYVVPRLRLGNVQVLPQPMRGSQRARESEIFHDKTLPVHHAYRAIYHQLTAREPVDAFVNLGTHGTQEWLSGKELGQWVYDDTQSTVSNIPVIYAYNIGNSGEAMVAKRRGRAVLISHNTPAFAPAGLHGELLTLHELLHQLGSLQQGRVFDNTREQVWTAMQESGLDLELQLSREDLLNDWDTAHARLHGHLESLAALSQPLGKHVFGSPAEPAHLLTTILQILGQDYLRALDPAGEHALLQDFEALTASAPYLTLHAYLIDGQPLQNFPATLQASLTQAHELWDKFNGEQEMESLLAALEARYVPPGTGADPLRNPDALPTGKNIYVFDPSRIPTQAAWEAGVALADSLLANYREEQGHYPAKVALALFSTESFNHYGVVEAEVLHLLGVKPVWNPRGQPTGVEVIPANALGRPRVDVVLTLTGAYRDNLPGVVRFLQEAINTVAALDEPENHVFHNTLALARSLQQEGLDAEQAALQARLRVFGAEQGQYGTGLSQASRASDLWDEDSALSGLFLDRMATTFGNEDTTSNRRDGARGLLLEQLKGVEVALMSRSSNSQGLLSSQEPFEYLGGLSLAIREANGTAPALMIADLRNTDAFAHESVASFIGKELRTRMFHPRWITEMMAEGYNGATEFSDSLGNFWGWNVMDASVVRADQWRNFFDIYVEDSLDLGLREFFETQHPAALAQMAERMLEAVRKGYWDAPEEVVATLVQTYQDLSTRFDVQTRNAAFEQFLSATAQGFGLNAPGAASPQGGGQATPEAVSGQVLRQTPTATAPPVRPWLLLLLAALVACGFAASAWQNRRFSASPQD